MQRPGSGSEREAEDYASHPLLGADPIGRIPRLGRVAKIIMYQNKSFDGTGFPIDDVKKDQIPLEARILHVVLPHDELQQKGWSPTHRSSIRSRGATAKSTPSRRR